MGERGKMLQGVALGAGLMYLLDPNSGRRRRAMARDQLVHTMHDLGDVVETGARDLGNRARGLIAETGARLRGEEVDDQVLTERVRSGIGRVVSHPHAIDVEARDGVITLSGPVLRHEVDRLLSEVRSVRGVRDVEQRLEIHDRPENVSALQGGRQRPGSKPELLQENWTPGVRLIAAATGGLLILSGMRRGGITGALSRLAGTAILARSLTNMSMSRISGINAGRRAVDIQKSINVDAPVKQVFEFFSNFEQLPRFMSHLIEVRETGEGMLHWVAKGPAGSRFEWDAVVTEMVPNETISWKSVPGSMVGNAGTVRFQPNEKGGTRIDVRMCYNPPAGAIGHGIASFFGVDPKSAMDEDLVRLKSLIEEGKTSAHSQTIERIDIERDLQSQQSRLA